MKEGWVKILTVKELIKAKLAEDMLKQHGIESHILNKPDSVLPIGEAELYALPDNAEAAIRLLQENDFLEKTDHEGTRRVE